jgi:DNA ligase-1
MLACKTPEDLSILNFPVLHSPKLDGIRCLITERGPMSRTMKPIRNEFVQSGLTDPKLIGLDGELIVGDPTSKSVYRDTNSAVMSIRGEPDFTYYVFDRWDLYEHPFEDRLAALEDQHAAGALNGPVTLHRHDTAFDVFQLLLAEQWALEAGYEGLVTRCPMSLYKFNRSTLKEQGMVKIKRFEDGEAEVIAVEELMHNGNEAELDERGYTKRSSAAAGKTPGGMMGSLVCRTPEGVEFDLGTGFTAEERKRIWSIRSSVVGMLVKYKSFRVGVKDKPRHPVFLGFRDEEDV